MLLRLVVVCEGERGKLVERDRVLAQQGEQLRRHVGELHAPLDRERRSGEKRGDVIDAAAFLCEHPVRAQDVERVEPFAFAVLDQTDGECFAFADDPHWHEIIRGDVLLFVQQVERSFAALACTDSVQALLAAPALHLVDDEILQQSFRADVGGEGRNARQGFRAGVKRRGPQAGIGYGHNGLLVAEIGFERRGRFGGICRDGCDLGLHD